VISRASGPILVTGASGFIGAALIPALAARFGSNRIVAAGGRSPPDHLPQGVEGAVLDLDDPQGVRDLVTALSPATVIHLAAQSSVQQSTSDPAAVWSTNMISVVGLAQAVQAARPDALFVQASSAEVYGRSFLSGEALTEDAPLQPGNPYARSKAACEMVLGDIYGPEGRLVILRTFNHIGPGQDERFVAAAFAAQIARIEAGEAEPVIRVGDLSAERDFGDIDDLVGAYEAVLTKADALPPVSTFNVCSGVTRPVGELLATLKGMARVAVEIEVDEARLRPQGIPRAAGSHAALTAATGWRPQTPFETSLQRILDAWRAKTGLDSSV
jgi:GDP-4-dehydro-6-deoxy-D-mannose reductase